MIVLDADTVNTLGKCFANGGGGGEGGNSVSEALPRGESTAPNAAAAGGRNGTMFGGDGGDGGFGTLGGLPGGNGSVGAAGGGGGGGGGGVGVIRVFARQQSGTSDLSKVSPRPA